MKWSRLKGMPDVPNCCAACGSNPATLQGEQTTAYWAEGVDIDWGSNLYLCDECVQILSDLAGRVTKGGFDDLARRYEELLEKYNELKAEHEEQEALVEQIRGGVAARKRLKETASTR